MIGRVERTESEETTLVPNEYWETIRERTGAVTKHDVETLEHLEAFLPERQFERLQSKLRAE